MVWLRPNQTKPSMNWCRAKRQGMAANKSSRRCFTSAKVATPMAPSTVLPTKLALAEKHTLVSAFDVSVNEMIREQRACEGRAICAADRAEAKPASGMILWRSLPGSPGLGAPLSAIIRTGACLMLSERPTHKRFLLAFWLFVLSAISFLDRTNISI